MKQKSVLIVDRNELLLESLAEIFALNGYTVITADSGMTALNHAQSFLPDVVICDVRLPELNGYDLYMNLQAKPHTKHIPVVFFIAETSNAHLLRSRLQIPMEHIVFKPFAVEELLDAAHYAITNFSGESACGAGSRA